jgi:hypothetical protein
VRINRLIPPLTAATVAVLTLLGQAAHAELLIQGDKSSQRMTVTVNGEHLYDWPVTTGGSGYDTPSGTFKPFRMEIDHYSLRATQSWSSSVAWLRAAVGEERSHTMGIGEAGEDG